jgi:hypothetical protein
MISVNNPMTQCPQNAYGRAENPEEIRSLQGQYTHIQA